MTQNQTEAVEAALALADSADDWKAYSDALDAFRPFMRTDRTHVWRAAEILAGEVRRLRGEIETLNLKL